MAIPRLFTDFDIAGAEEIRETVGEPVRDEKSGIFSFGNVHCLTPTFGLTWELDPRVTSVPSDSLRDRFDLRELSREGRQKLRHELIDEVCLQALLSNRQYFWWDYPTRWRFMDAGEWKYYSLEESRQLESAFFKNDTTISLPVGRRHKVDFVHGTWGDLDRGGRIDRVALDHFFPLRVAPSVRPEFSLINAASLCIWGLRDHHDSINRCITSMCNDQTLLGALELRYSEARTQGMPYAQTFATAREACANIALPELQPLLAFLVANCLRRPLIVLSENRDSPCRGLYLPLLWRDAYGCFPCEPTFPGFTAAAHTQLANPLLLAFRTSTGKFAPMLPARPSQTQRQAQWLRLRTCVTDFSGSILPHFFTRGELEPLAATTLLHAALNIEEYSGFGHTAAAASDKTSASKGFFAAFKAPLKRDVDVDDVMVRLFGERVLPHPAKKPKLPEMRVDDKVSLASKLVAAPGGGLVLLGGKHMVVRSDLQGLAVELERLRHSRAHQLAYIN